MTTDPATLAPSTLVEATVRGVPGVLAFRSDEAPDGKTWGTPVRIGDRWWHSGTDLTDVRPVELVRPGCVQLDPEDEATVDRLLLRYQREYVRSDGTPRVAVQQTLRALRDEQAKPAEIAEPTGLGAVVRDARGEKWVRTFLRYGTGWVGSDEMSGHEHWSSIPKPVEVLSHGVNGDGSEVEVP